MPKYGIVPITIDKELFDIPGVRRAVRNIMEIKAKAVKVDFGVTVQTWDTKPKFIIDRSGSNGSQFVRTVGTDSDIYKWVNGGTKAHTIAPRNSPFLIFQVGFSPKTKPRVIGSGQGKRFGKKVKLSRPVHHPGTKARKFDDEIAKKWQRLLPGIIQRAIDTEIEAL